MPEPHQLRVRRYSGHHLRLRLHQDQSDQGKAGAPAHDRPCGATGSCCPWRRPRPTRPCAWAGARSMRRTAWPKMLGLKKLWVKDDGQNPTASLKDRASAMAVAKAREAGAEVIACSSTGNAASSLAGNAAAAGLKTYIFVPSRAPKGKVAQLMTFGATVISVQGNYEETFELSQAGHRPVGLVQPQRRHQPLPLRGQEDRRARDRGAARLADARTTSPSPSATAAPSRACGRASRTSTPSASSTSCRA